MLARIAIETEGTLGDPDLAADPSSGPGIDVTGAVSRAACRLATSVEAAAIVTTTTTGNTARLIARHRPLAPILGVTTSIAIARQLNLSWGVIPAATSGTTALSDLGDLIATELAEHRLASPGDHVVIAAGLPLGFSDTANLLQVRTLEEPARQSTSTDV
jgi:pyruvate kinase